MHPDACTPFFAPTPGLDCRVAGARAQLYNAHGTHAGFGFGSITYTERIDYGNVRSKLRVAGTERHLLHQTEESRSASSDAQRPRGSARR